MESKMQVIRATVVLCCSLMLAACAGQAKPVELYSKNSLNCGVMAGVTLLDRELTINAGERPTPGYGVEVKEQTSDRKGVNIAYEISKPAAGSMLPQMMTSPCRRITLPEDWKRLTVTDLESGQKWVFEQP